MGVNRRNYVKKYIWHVLDMYSPQEYRGGTNPYILLYICYYTHIYYYTPIT